MTQFPWIDSSLTQARAGLANAISKAAAERSAEIRTDTQPSQGALNSSRWQMIVESSATDTSFVNGVRYGGREVVLVRDGVNNRITHSIVANGRTAQLAGTGENTPVYHRRTQGAVPHTISDIITVTEQYDDNAYFTRWADGEQSIDLRLCVIVARSGTINASYTVEDVRQEGLIYAGVVPSNRITAIEDGIDWKAAAIGSWCVVAIHPTTNLLVLAWINEQVVVNNCPSSP